MNVTKHPDGYLVRVKRAGVEHRRFVANAPGARKKADRLARELRRKYPAVRAHRLRKRARNNTGVVGVTRSEGRFQITWIDRNGRRRSTSIHFTPKTKRSAWRRALQKRRAFVRQARRTRLY